MIAALMNEETIAINTASPSAVRTKLNPSGRIFEMPIVWFLSTDGSITQESTKDEATTKNESLFLTVSEILPITGRVNAPMTGRKTIRINISCFSISDLIKNQRVLSLVIFFLSENLLG